MVAATFQFHHGSAVIALLVFVLFGSFEELEHFRVLGAFSITVRWAVAGGADFVLALLAFSDAVADVFRLNPLTAIRRRTVDTICGRIFKVLCVPLFLLFVGE